MNEFLKSADDARRLLRGFAAISEVAAAFEDAGRAVQAKDEAEKALAGLRADIDVAKAELAAAKDAVQQERSRAKHEAEVVLAKAKDKAEKLAADAGQKAETLAAKAYDDLAAAQLKVAEAEDKAAAALRDRDALAAEVDALEKRAEKARAYLQKLAG